MWISLIGFNSAGKSTLGRRLARLSERRLVDLDQAVVEHAGRTLPEIFTAGGPAAFRDLEAEVLADLDPDARIVLATGAGTVERTAARRLLAERGLVVWLDAPWINLRARLAPAGPGAVDPIWEHLGEDGLAKLYARRRPMYAACARARVDTSTVNTTKLMRRLVGLSSRLQPEPAATA